MLVANNEATKIFSIPVEWVVTENLEVKASSLEEAVKYINDNADEISLGDEPAYIDGTYRISADEDFDMDTEKICKNLDMYGYKVREATEYDV